MQQEHRQQPCSIKPVGSQDYWHLRWQRMATESENRVDGMPRDRVLCSLTGEVIFELTHPWLEQVRCHLLKKWTWSFKGIYLPTAVTLFHLHFEVDQQPVDDFQCLGDLASGRPLDILCLTRAPQKPDVRHKKCLEEAIEQLQGQRLWSLLRRYRLPSLVRDRRENQMNPLLLVLQAGPAGSGRPDESVSPLSMLLDAHCDPNVVGEDRLSTALCSWAPTKQG